MSFHNEYKKRINDYFDQKLPNKFIVDDNALLSFVKQQRIIIQPPDTHDTGGRSGVALLYFLHQKIIPPEINYVEILRPYFHEHLYIPDIHGFGNAPATSTRGLDLFLADLQKNNITGAVSRIPVRPTYDEIIAAWREKLRAELSCVRLTHTDDSLL